MKTTYLTITLLTLLTILLFTQTPLQTSYGNPNHTT